MSKTKEVRKGVEMEGRLLAGWHMIICRGDSLCNYVYVCVTHSVDTEIRGLLYH